jgi:hypothetical protein
MLKGLKNLFKNKHSNSGIPTTENIMENRASLHGEDPGVIPPDDNPNPLIQDDKR